MVNPNVRALEVYTLVSGEEFVYVNFINITSGCITQTESIAIQKKLNESDSDILGHTILTFRERFNIATPKIVTNIPTDFELKGTEIAIPKMGDAKKLVQLSLKNAFYYRKECESAKINYQNKQYKNYTLLQLKADLNLKDLPRHIECFDNSNLQGTHPVAAMVCFIDGKPAKKEYRHYNIKTVVGADDFSSMYEIVGRRYKRLVEEQRSLPQLVIVDGGKGQLNAAVRALKVLDLHKQLTIISIAKRLEEIYLPEDAFPIHINKKSKSLMLIQKVRNEAHRFAIAFHRDKRSINSLQTSLRQISGIGSLSCEKLLTAFKSINNIKTASKQEIAKIVGTSKAAAVIAYFQQRDIGKKSADIQSVVI